MEYRVHNRILTVLIASLVILSASVTVSHASIWDHLTGTPKKSKQVSVEVKTFRVTNTEDGNKTKTMEELPGLSRIKAGDDSSYMPVIKNTGNTCDLRIRLYANAGEDKVNILKYCYGYQGSWEYKDGWFYLKEPFKKDRSYTICDGFHFPEDWNYRENNRLDVTVEAEAVQQEPKTAAVATGDTKNLMISMLVFLLAGTACGYAYGRSHRKKMKNSLSGK